jgi:iron complex transport system ATP-binding protein
MKKKQHIKIENLTIGYRQRNNDKVVAAEINASVARGDLICLLGANGTGKSTLLRTICAFQPFFQGQVHLMGKSIKQLNEKDISRLLSVVLTEKVSVPNATVYELVSYGRSPYTGIMGRLSKADRDITGKSIAQCGIEHKMHELLTSVSDGERQKAFIAKALAQDTPIVLLDEPTAFLDLPSRVEIIRLLRKVASDSGKSILLSTHDLDLALQMADKLWLLKDGGPLITGSPEDLLLNNAFQEMFRNHGIIFDTHTGLFRVEYRHNATLPVKGHGFEYVLLRRAFARKGIKTVPHENGVKIWVEIIPGSENPFLFYKDNDLLLSEKSIGNLVTYTLNNHINSKWN